MKQLKIHIGDRKTIRMETASPQGTWSHSLVLANSVLHLLDIDSPKNLVTEQVTENTATVSWDPVQAVIDRYLVRYTSADGDTREVPVGKEQSSTVLTGLRPGVEYTVHVWAQKGDQESRKADTTALTGTVRGGATEPFAPNRRLPSSASSLRRGAGNTVLPRGHSFHLSEVMR